MIGLMIGLMIGDRPRMSVYAAYRCFLLIAAFAIECSGVELLSAVLLLQPCR
jgi:hypothetical protein